MNVNETLNSNVDTVTYALNNFEHVTLNLCTKGPKYLEFTLKDENGICEFPKEVLDVELVRKMVKVRKEDKTIHIMVRTRMSKMEHLLEKYPNALHNDEEYCWMNGR